MVEDDRQSHLVHENRGELDLPQGGIASKHIQQSSSESGVTRYNHCHIGLDVVTRAKNHRHSRPSPCVAATIDSHLPECLSMRHAADRHTRAWARRSLPHAIAGERCEPADSSAARRSARRRRGQDHSHSMVPGGLLVMS
jgi:hypothetical protein